MFEGKTVIVTGASSGIGAACARELSRRGANVVLAARREDRLAGVAGELEKGRTHVVPTDISVPGDCDALVEATLERFGAVDGLVANAGVAQMGTMDDLDNSDFERVIGVNVAGTYRTIRAAWPALKAAKGAVVCTSSVSGIGGDFGGFAYNASKGAVSNMVRGLALDWGKSNIRVNAVAPSFTRTEMSEGLEEDRETFESMVARIPMGRPAEPIEIATVVAFLLSEDARFVNGVVLPVDGGLNASNGQAPVA